MASEFDDDEKTPPLPDPPQAQLDRAQLVAHAKRLATLEERVTLLEERPGVDRMLRQWRLFRKYMTTWLKEHPDGTDEYRLQRQWRRLRKYLAIWMKED